MSTPGYLIPTNAITTKDALVRNRLQSALDALSEGTRRQYQIALTKFAEFGSHMVGMYAHEPWWDVLLAVVAQGPLMTGYLADRFTTEQRRERDPRQPLAPATVAQRVAAIRWLLALLNEMQLIRWTIRIRSPKATQYRDTAGPELPDVTRLLEAADRVPGLLGLRDAALVRLLFVLALRRSEVSSLTVGSWLRDRGRLAIRGKGRDDLELVTVPDQVGDHLDSYLAARGALQTDSPLLVGHGRFSNPSMPLTGNGIYRALARISSAAGVAQVRCHGLRHRAITEALDRTNGDVRRVAAYARHRNVSTTLRYDDQRRDAGGAVAIVLAGIADPEPK